MIKCIYITTGFILIFLFTCAGQPIQTPSFPGGYIASFSFYKNNNNEFLLEYKKSGFSHILCFDPTWRISWTDSVATGEMADLITDISGNTYSVYQRKNDSLKWYSACVIKRNSKGKTLSRDTLPHWPFAGSMLGINNNFLQVSLLLGQEGNQGIVNVQNRGGKFVTIDKRPVWSGKALFCMTENGKTPAILDVKNDTVRKVTIYDKNFNILLSKLVYVDIKYGFRGIYFFDNKYLVFLKEQVIDLIESSSEWKVTIKKDISEQWFYDLFYKKNTHFVVLGLKYDASFSDRVVCYTKLSLKGGLLDEKTYNDFNTINYTRAVAKKEGGYFIAGQGNLPLPESEKKTGSSGNPNRGDAMFFINMNENGTILDKKIIYGK